MDIMYSASFSITKKLNGLTQNYISLECFPWNVILVFIYSSNKKKYVKNKEEILKRSPR